MFADPERDPERSGGLGPLVISSFTLGTKISFEDRVRAAAAAGFEGIGLRAENYWDAEQTGLDDQDMIAIAHGYGVRILEVEYLTGWGLADGRDEPQRRKEETVFAMARAFGVRHVNAGLLEPLPREVITSGFAGLCDRAGPDLTVALEFMPYSGIPDLPAAWQIVQGADRPNSGLLIDAWHWARAGTAIAELDRVPADRIVAVQLSDVQERPMDPLRAESLTHRLPPGDGYGDPIGLIRALRAKGVQPRIMAVEVTSDDLISRGPEIAALTVGQAARGVLARSTVNINPA
jgi:sugar phosphate isomerase/epimerase